MKRLTLALFSVALLHAQVPAHTLHNPHTPNATVMYGAMGYTSPSLWSQTNTWLGQRFDLVLGGDGSSGDAHGGNLTQLHWATYTDIAVSELRYIYDTQAALAAQSIDIEGAILHSSIDMQWDGSLAPKNIDWFDIFENPRDASGNLGGHFSQGAFTCTGGCVSDSGTFTDVTEFVIGGAPTTVSDTVYFGYMMPFDQANFVITTAKVGGSVAFYYWNGTTWTAFTNHFVDATAGLTTTGKVSWYPPSDWAKRTLSPGTLSPVPVTTTHSKYWLKAVYTCSSGCTAPIITTVYADNYAIASGSNNARGWDPAASGRINIGTPLEYNPTPPSISTAKFKYQGRVPVSANGANYYWGNPTDTQGGHLSFGKTLQYLIDSIPGNLDSAFFDDGSRYPGGSGGASTPLYPSNPTTALGFMDFTHGSGADLGFIAAQTAMFLEVGTNLKTEHGSNYWVGTNSPLPGTPGSVTLGDFTFLEAFVTPMFPNYCGYADVSFGQCPYDLALPATNTNNTKFFFQALGAWDFQTPWYGGNYSVWHYPDHGNRGPMAVLAQNYIGANANTGFMFYGATGTNSGINNYVFTDQVFVYGQQLATTTSITSDVTGTQKTIGLSGSTGCKAGTSAGYHEFGPGSNPIPINMFRIGTKTLGDTVGGLIGRVYDYGGNDLTPQLRSGSVETNGGGFPTSLYAGDTAKFGSITATFLTPTVGGSGVGQFWVEYWNGTIWAPLTLLTDGTNFFGQDGTITWNPPSDWASLTGLPPQPMAAAGYYIRINSYPHFALWTLFSGEWSTLFMPNFATGTDAGKSTTSNIYNSYPSGTPVYCIDEQHLSTPSVKPAASDVYSWTRWFPAMSTDLGIPNVAGLGGGLRMVSGTPIAGISLAPWKTGGGTDHISGQVTCPGTGPQCADLWRRDYTNAIVLYRPWAGAGTPTPIIESELDTYSVPVALGATYYPLAADGTTGAGITSIQLRGAEGAILMTSPIATRSRFSGTFSGTFR